MCLSLGHATHVEVVDALSFWLDLIHEAVVVVSFAHLDASVNFVRIAVKLFAEFNLRGVFVAGQVSRHVVDVLEPVLVAVVDREFSSVQLNTEIDETCVSSFVNGLVDVKARVGLFQI